MARLPQPGGDQGTWGDILNDYLSQVHKADGTLKDDSVTADAIAPGAVTKNDVGLSNVDDTADSAKPISTAQQAVLDTKADTSALATKLNTADLDAQTASKITTSGTATQGALSAAFETIAPPSYAANHTSRPYDQQRSLYRSTAAKHREVRAALGLGLAGLSLVPIMFIGDSHTAGYSVSGVNAAKGVPGVSDPVTVMRNLFKAAGWPVTGGWVFPSGGHASSVDTRWTFPVGTWSGTGTTNNGFRFTSSTNGTALFTSDLPGTVAEFTVFCNSNAPIAYSIDSGTEVLVTATPGSVNKTVITGLANTTHSISIRRNGSSTVWIGPARVRATTGLSISNAGIWGSLTSDWLPSQGGGVYYNPFNLAMGLETPRLIVAGLGANEALTLATVPEMVTPLTSAIQAAQAIAPTVMRVHAPIADSLVAGNWTNWVEGMYGVADATGALLIDHTDAMGTNAEGIANGLLVDGYHPLAAGYAAMARRDMQALLAA